MRSSWKRQNSAPAGAGAKKQKIESVILKATTMTDKTIKFIIDLINSGQSSDLIFTRPLTQQVLIGRVWVKNDKGDICTDSGYNMFFIQNKRKVTVAAVVDMGRQDLHVFVHPKHRKRGHLVKALRSVILPFLFEQGREEQRITFQTVEAMRHAENVGFHITSDDSAVITPECIPKTHVPCLGTIVPTDSQIERIKIRIKMAVDHLRMARDDFESAFGEDDTWEGLDYLAREVAKEEWNVGDHWQDFKKSKGN